MNDERFAADLAEFDRQSKLAPKLYSPVVQIMKKFKYEEQQMRFDNLYATQDTLVFKAFLGHIRATGVEEFLDIGSRLNSMIFFAQFARCHYLEVRPPAVSIDRVKFVKGQAQALPFADGRFKVITSLHAVEHFGLGRYGDTIDFEGDIKGLREIKRCLSDDGVAFISVPIHKPACARTQFHEQRIYSLPNLREMIDDADLKIEVLQIIPTVTAEVKAYLNENPETSPEDILELLMPKATAVAIVIVRPK